MRFYNEQHQFYCGIDLHARTMYLCIMDHEGTIHLHRNLQATAQALADAIQPYQHDLALEVECIFTWYWVADLCSRLGVEFVLGHALYMKTIHGGKVKNDKIDSQKIAALLRSGMLPMAYVYPQAMRSTRDLLRPGSTFPASMLSSRHTSRTPTPSTTFPHSKSIFTTAQIVSV
jgi:transposase